LAWIVYDSNSKVVAVTDDELSSIGSNETSLELSSANLAELKSKSVDPDGVWFFDATRASGSRFYQEDADDTVYLQVPLLLPSGSKAGDKYEVEVYDDSGTLKTRFATSAAAGASTFAGLTDTPSSLGTAGQVPVVNSAGDGLEFADQSSGGASTFVALTDTPSALGTAGQVPTINSAGDAIEFATPTRRIVDTLQAETKTYTSTSTNYPAEWRGTAVSSGTLTFPSGVTNINAYAELILLERRAFYTSSALRVGQQELRITVPSGGFSGASPDPVTVRNNLITETGTSATGTLTTYDLDANGAWRRAWTNRDAPSRIAIYGVRYA